MNTKSLIDKLRSRIAKANWATIKQFSLVNNIHIEKNKDVNFVNKECKSIDDFIINDKINSSDLKKLAELNEITLGISKAWYSLTIELIVELNESGWDKKVSCVKEKYASLVFSTDNKYYTIVEKYKKKSQKVCETCGERGELRYNTDWDYVACRKHYLENRGNIISKESGFNHDGNLYRWSEIKNIYFEDLYNDIYKNDRYKFLVLEFKKNKIKHQGWIDNKLYVSEYTIGYGNFVSNLPIHFKNIDSNYINNNFKNIIYCETCGYKAVYFDICECCEQETLKQKTIFWKKISQRKNKTIDIEFKNLKYLKQQQIFWKIGSTEESELLLNNYYDKSINHKILFSTNEYEEIKRLCE